MTSPFLEQPLRTEAEARLQARNAAISERLDSPDTPLWAQHALVALRDMPAEEAAEWVGMLARVFGTHDDLIDALGDLIELADFAMKIANSDGGEFDRKADLAEARVALKKARSR